MNQLRELLRFEGRLSRLGFWRAYLKLAILGVLAFGVGLFAILGFGRIGGVFMLPTIAVILANAAICVRRLHDRNRTGWLVPIVVLFPLAGSLWVNNGSGRYASPILLMTILLAAFAANIWGLVEIGFRRGTRGANRYGDEPAVGA